MEDYDTSNGVHCALKFIGGKMIEDVFKDINIDDVFSGLFSYIDVYNDTRSKKFYRKNRFKGKCKKTYIIKYNYLHDFLPSPDLLIMCLRNIGRGGRI